MEKEIEVRAKIIEAIKSNASPNAITKYWEMSTDDIEQAAEEIFEITLKASLNQQTLQKTDDPFGLDWESGLYIT